MFDDRLKKLRIERGLSQQEVADDLGLKVNTYRNYENNEREPSSTTLIKISAYFGVTLDYLLNYHYNDEKNVQSIEEIRKDYRDILADLTQEEKIELKRYSSYLRSIRENKNTSDK